MAIITSLFNTNIDNVANLFVGISATAAKSSADGVTWVGRTFPVAGVYYDLAFGNDIVISVSSSSNSVAALSSVDGITWLGRTLPAAGVGKGWYSCSFGNDIFVAATGGNTNCTIAAYSQDGITWSQSVIGSGDWRTIAYGNGTFVAFNYGSNTTQLSTDGINWVNGPTLPINSNWISATYDLLLNRFVVISNTLGNIAAYSDDNGLSWISCILPTNTTWRSITTNNLGKFVAVSNENNVYCAYSNDGINWVDSKLPANASWSCVCYGNAPNVFSASANNSTNAATSVDGINWDIQVQASAAFNKTIYAPITWRTGDSLTINNGARVTVNTNQNKFWSSMTITNGELYITNSSTTVGNRFLTGRISGASVQAITPGSGLGSIVVQGDWIQIGTGDTTTNQIMTIPYNDYIPCVWVETGSTYEMWLNVSSAYGGTLQTYDETNGGLNQVSTGQRGKFFVQIPNSEQDKIYEYNNTPTKLGSRTIIVTGSTSGLYPGASISGTGIPLSSTVEQIINDTTIIINFAATASNSTTTIYLYNPIVSQFTNKIKFVKQFT